MITSPHYNAAHPTQATNQSAQQNLPCQQPEQVTLNYPNFYDRQSQMQGRPVNYHLPSNTMIYEINK